LRFQSKPSIIPNGLALAFSFSFTFHFHLRHKWRNVWWWWEQSKRQLASSLYHNMDMNIVILHHTRHISSFFFFHAHLCFTYGITYLMSKIHTWAPKMRLSYKMQYLSQTVSLVVNKGKQILWKIPAHPIIYTFIPLYRKYTTTIQTSETVKNLVHR